MDTRRSLWEGEVYFLWPKGVVPPKSDWLMEEDGIPEAADVADLTKQTNQRMGKNSNIMSKKRRKRETIGGSTGKEEARMEKKIFGWNFAHFLIDVKLFLYFFLH
jgi:hypothetical protein